MSEDVTEDERYGDFCDDVCGYAGCIFSLAWTCDIPAREARAEDGERIWKDPRWSLIWFDTLQKTTHEDKVWMCSCGPTDRPNFSILGFDTYNIIVHFAFCTLSYQPKIRIREARADLAVVSPMDFSFGVVPFQMFLKHGLRAETAMKVTYRTSP